MKSLLLFAMGLVVVGCSGEPAPEVGDAPNTKGIVERPLPRPRPGSAAAAAAERRTNAPELSRLRGRN